MKLLLLSIWTMSIVSLSAIVFTHIVICICIYTVPYFEHSEAEMESCTCTYTHTHVRTYRVKIMVGEQVLFVYSLYYVLLKTSGHNLLKMVGIAVINNLTNTKTEGVNRTVQ